MKQGERLTTIRRLWHCLVLRDYWKSRFETKSEHRFTVMCVVFVYTQNL